VRTLVTGVCESCKVKTVFTVSHHCEHLDQCVGCTFYCPVENAVLRTVMLTMHEFLYGESYN